MLILYFIIFKLFHDNFVCVFGWFNCLIILGYLLIISSDAAILNDNFVDFHCFEKPLVPRVLL